MSSKIAGITGKKRAGLFTILVAVAMQAALLASVTGVSFASGRPNASLPGDSAVSAAAYNQNNPQIAPGGGGYLAVWEDSRTNYVNLIEGAAPGGGQESGQLLKDIFAVRLDANGQPIDQTPIAVSQA